MKKEFAEDEIQEVFKLQKAYALQLRSSSARERIALIKNLHDWVLSHREDIQKAMFADYKKPFKETDISAIYPVVSEARHAMKNLKEWMRPDRVPTPLIFTGTSARIAYEPKGVSLVIAPWNYPFNLSICPLISAISAGCTAVIKPSEMTPHVSALIKSMIGELFNKVQAYVVEGGRETSQLLLSMPFDHIFFTGSPMVGKVVMRSAADHLSSVTLELGGKSPAIIAEDANLKDAARKIAAKPAWRQIMC